MTMPKILVIDDEAPILHLVRGYLERDGMQVFEAQDGPSGLDSIREHAPDVVVLDVMLPGMDGLEVLRQARRFSDAYVIMLTARADEVDRIVGLSVGADDYLTKPFSPRELVARIRALLRRPRGTRMDGGDAWRAGDLEVDARRHVVTVADRPVALTAIEFDLVAVLIRERGVVFSRQQLLDRVWGMDYVGDEHVVDVHLANLRRKLGDDPDQARFIETVRGVGYRFREEDR
jgi:two-component system, OmpR family, alkaline phosphatase synthesis response regulator PhoP